MTPTYWLPVSAVLFAAIYLMTGAAGMYPERAGSFSEEELKARCRQNSTAIFAHPGKCQLYYNCGNQALHGPPSLLSLHMEECRYPQLFSNVTLRCHPFDEVDCGERYEPVDCDEYLDTCHFSCRPCTADTPSCRGFPDGVNVFRSKEWTPYYAICRSQRNIGTGMCPPDLTLNRHQFWSPEKRRCVSVYEEPNPMNGTPGINCTDKADGLHIDDVSHRPDVYYRCFSGTFFDIYRCEHGHYFDEVTTKCAINPLYNRFKAP